MAAGRPPIDAVKPFAESCEENKAPILNVLKEVFANSSRVLEIGSGTGQHAVYFAQHLPYLTWLTSDVPANQPGIHAWLAEADLPNTRPPINLDVSHFPWPVPSVDAVFSANTLHIMSWQHVEDFFRGVGQVLARGGPCAVYGPFNYQNEFTCISNRRFDGWLKQRDPQSGIRNFEDLDQLAMTTGMELLSDYEMPVNNRILVWVKK